MKINRFIALAAIALLVVGAMGAIAARSFAHTASAPAAQSQDCADDQADDGTEAESVGADSDSVEAQCDDQNEVDDANDAADAEDANDAANAIATLGAPAITAEAAQKIGEAYLNAGAATKVGLDNENGRLVYSVEINGTDVKVDGMTGKVLGTEDSED